jgi:hypothetical protein
VEIDRQIIKFKNFNCKEKKRKKIINRLDNEINDFKNNNYV